MYVHFMYKLHNFNTIVLTEGMLTFNLFATFYVYFLFMTFGHANHENEYKWPSDSSRQNNLLLQRAVP